MILNPQGGIIGVGDRALKMLGEKEDIFEKNLFDLMLGFSKRKLLNALGLHKETFEWLFKDEQFNGVFNFTSIFKSKKKFEKYK